MKYFHIQFGCSGVCLQNNHVHCMHVISLAMATAILTWFEQSAECPEWCEICIQIITIAFHYKALPWPIFEPRQQNLM